MSEQKFATTLDDAYFNFEIGEPLPAGSPFYVRRQDKVVSKLKRTLLRAKGKASVPRHLFSGHTGSGKSTELKKIEGEIDEIRWISAKELLAELKMNPQIYCPWMLIALELLDKSEQSMLEKHVNVLSTWMNSEVHEGLLQAIKTHLIKDKWR